MKNLTILQKVVALIFLATTNLTFAQDDCATATNIADLTGVVCATSSPGTTSTLAAGSCDDGTIDTWFSFVAQGSTADVTVTSDIAGWRPEFLVLESDDNTCGGNFTEFGCADQPGNYVTINGIVGGLTPGNTYWVVVSSNGDLTTGTLDVCVVNLVSPPNEDFCSAITLIPDGSCLNGETNNGAAASWSGGCVTTGNPIVWYDITLTGLNTVLDIDLTTNVFGGGNVEMLLLTNDDVCPINNGATIVADYCGTAGTVISFTALTPGVQYYLGVSTLPANTGDFDICATESAPPAGCTDNEDCATAAPIVLSASGLPGVQTCLTDCNTGASAGIDPPGNNCYDSPNPTVWYSFTTDVNASTVDISLNSTELSNPVFTVWVNNCPVTNYLTNLCGLTSVTAGSVTPSTTYYIAVTGANGDEGAFDLCINQNIDASLCNIGDEITETASSDPLTPVGGPYSPGEVVDFCYDIYEYRKENCNWLQGIVPSFGDCWDPASFNTDGMPLVTTTLVNQGNAAGTWSWYPDGVVQYNNVGITGTLPVGADVGAGWYFACTGCAAGNNGPAVNDSYGDGQANGPGLCDVDGNGFTWSVCFQLTAGPVLNCANGTTDCTVSIKTYADAEIGSYAMAGCAGDAAHVAPATLACCPLFDNPGDQTVCDSYTFPTITGALLTGNEAYYTGLGGTGTQYNATDVVNWADLPSYPATIYIFDVTSCGIEISYELTIGQTPTVTMTALADLCIDAGTQLAQAGGTIAGGIYSGPGVTDNGNGLTYDFDPAAAGAGVHTITYTVITLPNPPGCSAFDTDNIEVFALPVVTFTAPADLCIDAGVQAALGGGTPVGGVYSGNG
ncbi:hypothetical protein OAL26_01955, partial [Flavobacteriales bacterium]|nr:hypothetical protein [Flavobacteriales bacterium]